MEGNLHGSSEIMLIWLIYQDYMVAPQSMKMDMIMIGAMYAPSDKLTYDVDAKHREKFNGFKNV